MANSERGEVAIVIGRRNLILILDIEAIGAIERDSGERLATAVQRLADPEFRIGVLLLFAKAMLSRRHPDLTAGMIGELVQGTDLNALRLAIFTAIRVAFPEAKAEKDDKPDPGDRESALWVDLLPDWLAGGYEEDLFWQSTPRQIDRHMIAEQRRRERDAQMRRVDLWTAAALARADKLPDFDAFVYPQTAETSSLDERMRKTMGGIALRMGRRR